MSVTYTSVLPVRDETVDFLAGLLTAERQRRGTRADTRALSCHDQAVLVLRWFLDGTRMSQLARDNAISASTGYDYLHEGIDVLAITVAFKNPKDSRLTLVQQQLNQAHNGLRAIAERGNALLKGTFKALRNVSLCPRRIGKIVAAAIVLLHFDHARTT